MAIYHFTVKIVSRANGQSIVASAAYRAGQSLRDERLGRTWDFSRKQGVNYSQILLPKGAPEWMADRERLWNYVEAVERRKDSQLARDVGIALPVELTHSENIELMRDYLQRHFVSQGMVADLSIHEDDSNNPHAHVLLSMREATSNGFGQKVRSWNAKAKLLDWRAAWADSANEHLARAGHAVRIDHRTLEAQGSELQPGTKIGVGRERQTEPDLPSHIAARVAAQERTARENGAAILEDPTVALRAITHQRATFTEWDMAKFLHTRTSGAEQFRLAMLRVTGSKELVTLGKDDRGRMRYSTREMVAAERSLLEGSLELSRRAHHGVHPSRQAAALSQTTLSEEQQAGFQHVTGAGDLKALVGVAGSGKSTLLAAARVAWEADGLTVKGAALSGIAAENLQIASGIQSRTLASYEWAWIQERDQLRRRDVLVIDETGMIGTQQLQRMLAAAEKAHAKVVLVGDPEQLQAIEAGAAFRGIIGQVGMMELTQVQRQRESWAREATEQLASGRTGEALHTYESRGAVVAAATRDEAQKILLAAWSKDRQAAPAQSRLILAYTRESVGQLNAQAREILKGEGRLSGGEVVQTARGKREFAAWDRLLFLKNEKSLGVKNGTLGTVERVGSGMLQVRLDGKEEARIVVETKDYADFDHGYASTVHKSQGATVDRTYVLASRYFDRHTTYVALSRHRYSAMLFYGQDDFAADPKDARQQLEHTLSRARPKELAHDYLDPVMSAAPMQQPLDNSPAAVQARAIESWKAMRAKQEHPSPEQVQSQSRERWQAYRREFENLPGQGTEKKSAEQSRDLSQSEDDGLSL